MFQPLKLDVSCPLTFSDFVSKKLEKHFLAPVHEMFRYPLLNRSRETHFEFTIANNLLAVISGLSTLCYKPKKIRGDTGDRFRKTLIDHYPWQEEPTGGLPQHEWALELYKTYRNSLAHALGIERKGALIKFLRIRAKRGDKFRGHSERKLKAIETSVARPGWSPTLQKDSLRTVLHLEGLYWGTRRLTENLSASTLQMKQADAYLKKRANW